MLLDQVKHDEPRPPRRLNDRIPARPRNDLPQSNGENSRPGGIRLLASLRTICAVSERGADPGTAGRANRENLALEPADRAVASLMAMRSCC